ncbi:MAG: hypothetical protein JJU05_13195 [Verrucomicrobia bacterium]|nr:hypothetical protein [Verrucomicrobiota bacterium]MCH8528947.1 hypothetical protein [Kiritimatiellia bacterium]
MDQSGQENEDQINKDHQGIFKHNKPKTPKHFILKDLDSIPDDSEENRDLSDDAIAEFMREIHLDRVEKKRAALQKQDRPSQ